MIILARLKKNIYIIATSFALLVSMFIFVNPPKAEAHVLLPQNVVEYIQNNPNASPAEIESYIRGNAPELSKKYQKPARCYKNS